tara:strand:- start:794 stop:1162 length:369 start_codon:yes stop_codon:yes gene_type:complete
MANCGKAIDSIGTYSYYIRGNVTNETEFNNNVKWVTGKDANGLATFGSKPDAVTWTKVKADMDKQDAFVSQDAINMTAKEYLTSTDWYHQRAADGGKAIPDNIKAKRVAERAKIVEYEEFKE